jgi:hypothetical protein
MNNKTEEEYEDYIKDRVYNISSLYKTAKSKRELDFILKRFNIKCIKNGKKSSAMGLKKNIKHKIIIMSITEPSDIFDYGFYIQNIKKTN